MVVNAVKGFFQGIVLKQAWKVVLRFVYSAVIDVVLSRLSTFGDKIDWDLVKKDVDKKVIDIVPGKFLENICLALAEQILVTVESLLEGIFVSEDIKKLLREGRFQEAAEILKDLLLKELIG